MKVAAIGDLHVGETGGSRSFAPLFEAVSREADVLALCGDLTNTGSRSEAERLCEALRACTIPIVGVLGNHDHEDGKAGEIEELLRRAGVRPLETHVQEIAGVGFAGVKGFGGGFGRYMLGGFGEVATKAFVEEATRECARLEHALVRLANLERVVVVLHYAPVAATVVGEPPEIQTFLGTSRLEEVIDRFNNVQAVFHGHAHRGMFEGRTRRGVPVYNVALDIAKPTGVPYALIEI